MKHIVRGHKKQAILDYIEKFNQDKHKNNPFVISRIHLMNYFENKDYTKKDIDELINELEHDGTIKTNTISIEIVYPKSEENEILNKWKSYLDPDSGFILLVSYAVLLISVFFIDVDMIIPIAIGPIILLIVYAFFNWISKIVYANIPIIKRINRKLLLANAISIVICLGIGIVGSRLLEGIYTTTILLTSIGVGAAIGSIIYAAVLKKK